MNKMMMVERLQERLSICHADALLILDTFLDEVARELVRGGKVSITGFGTFETKDHAATKARNPQTGEGVLVPARRNVRFRPGENLKALVNGDKALPKGIAIRKTPKYTYTPRPTVPKQSTSTD
jgi:Bacterial nucleoid DNA-binding protein